MEESSAKEQETEKQAVEPTNKAAKRPAIYVGVIVLLLLFFGTGTYSYFSPQLTLKSIKDAAVAQDKERLRDLIDFESVREGLKEDLKTSFVMSAGEDLEDNPFAGLGMALAGAMIGSLIDNFVTPSAIVQIMSQGKIDANPDKGGHQRSEVEADKGVRDAKDSPIIEGGYDGYSRYQVKIRAASAAPDEALGLVLRRQGFFSWKLSRIALPDKLLKGDKTVDAGPQEDSLRKDRALMDVRNLRAALKLYRTNNGVYPTTEEGLFALITKPENAKNQRKRG